jgi:mono/diheme cytochrome c family protein
MRGLELGSVLTGIVLLFAAVACAADEDPVSVNPDHPGYHLYRQYCGACHGLYARGDGPAASELKKPPSDLSQLSVRHGSPLPEDELIEFIDGRDMVASHGSREMPVWGDRLYRTMPSGDQREMRRLEALHLIVSYLESIQPGASPPARP